jgi:Flp pilus assembly protein TadG
MKINLPSNNHGQSLVEMALLLPVLLLLTVVTLDLGRGIYYYSVVYNAAREGARYGIIDPNDYTGIDNAARKLSIGLDPVKLYIDSCECGKPCVGNISCPANLKNIISVKATYTFQLVTPLANLITGKTQYSLESTSMMSIER